MSERTKAIAYTMNLSASAATLAEQLAAIEALAADRGFQVVDTIHDSEAGHNPEIDRVIDKHMAGGELVLIAFDTTRGRPMPEVWQLVRCEKCGEHKAVAAEDGTIMAGCDLEAVARCS